MWTRVVKRKPNLNIEGESDFPENIRYLSYVIWLWDEWYNRTRTMLSSIRFNASGISYKNRNDLPSAMIPLHVSGRERAVSWWSGGNQWLQPVAGARRPGIWSIERAPLAVSKRTSSYTRNAYWCTPPLQPVPDEASVPRAKKQPHSVIWGPLPQPPENMFSQCTTQVKNK